MSSAPGQHGWLATTPTHVPAQAREADDDVARVVGVYLEEARRLVHDAADHVDGHVVGDLGIDFGTISSSSGPGGRGASSCPRRALLEVVQRQVAEQLLHLQPAQLLVVFAT